MVFSNAITATFLCVCVQLQVNKESETGIIFQETGEPSVVHMESDTAFPFASELQFLSSEGPVAQEIGLSEEQSSEIADLLKQFRESTGVYTVARQRSLTDAGRAELDTRFAKETGDMREKLNRVFLPHQMERLEQILHYLVARYEGVGSVAHKTNGEAASASSINQGELYRCQAHFRDNALKLWSSFLGDLDAMLPQEIVAQQGTDWFKKNYSNPLFCEVLFATKDSDVRVVNPDLNKEIPARSYICYVLQKHGLWEQRTAGRQKMDEICSVVNSARDEGLQDSNRLQMDQTQFELLKRIAEDFQQQRKVFDQKLDDDIRNGMDRSLAVKHFREAVEELDRRCYERAWSEALLPFQEGVLSNALETRWAKLAWPKEIRIPGISKVQAEKFEAGVVQAIASLRNSFYELEGEFLKAQMDLLSKADAERINDLVSNRPKYLQPSILMFVRMESEKSR